MKYIFLIDIDGTLIPIYGKRVPKETGETIKELQKKGYKFAIATGRSLGSTQKVEGTSSFDYFACLMGLVIHDNFRQKSLQKLNLLDNDAAKELIDYFINEKRWWLYKDSFGDYTLIDDKDFMSYHNLKLANLQKLENDVKEKNIFQIFVSGEVDKNIIEKYSDKFEFVCVPNGQNGVNYDISAKGVDKSFIVKYFKENFKDYTIVAIGDSDNDIGMLKTADISVAMGNASESIKNICDIVIDSCENNGVEKFLREFIKQ